ncbi:MAG: ARMT1-like domain-containing protein [Planctomycetaceae bacterium]|jgi:uncharacterized protein with ATP-grasp and redox domains|nr:ARMT1-like domain-containing protein [Planctomycetaceae bacterium]
MPASLDCILCLTRQSLEAVRHATGDVTLHAEVLRRALAIALERGFTENPPFLAQDIQRIIRSVTGNDDPYSAEKAAANGQMLGLYDIMRERINTSKKPIDTAVHLAIAGNSIDNALNGSLSKEYIQAAIEKSIEQPLIGNIQTFEDAADKASSILYLADNCGEIVCDKLLIETMLKRWNKLKITVVVRGAAVLNDATLSDAAAVGLTEIVKVIDNGNDGVGTIIEQCSQEFKTELKASDLIISKGLANYETIVEYDKQTIPQPVIFLFKSKCKFISQLTNTKLGDLVLQCK